MQGHPALQEAIGAVGDPERLRVVRDLIVDTAEFDHEGYDRERWPTWREWAAGARAVPSRQVAVERLRLLGVLAGVIRGERRTPARSPI